MTNDELDIALASRIAGGDVHAENDLFLSYREQIECMVRIRLKVAVPIQDQEDIVSEIQEAVLISSRRGGYNPSTGKTLGAYIAGIVSKVIGQYFRKKKKDFLQVGLPENIHVATDDMLSGLIDVERDMKLRQCLNNLKPKYKEVLLLRFYEKLSIEEIAQKLNLERRRVSESIHYAFKLLTRECKKENYFSIFSLILQINI